MAPGVFDGPLDPALVRELLADPRHHLAVALDPDATVVGFASGLHYVHPDKPAELWVNEVGVGDGHLRRGIGRQVLGALLDHGRSLGCREAWVLTGRRNDAARGLYRAAGGTEADEDLVMVSFDLPG